MVQVQCNQFFDIQTVTECRLTLKHACNMIKRHSEGLLVFRHKMIMKIMGTTERIFQSICKRSFKKLKNLELLCRCLFFFLIFTCFSLRQVKKKGRETKFFEKSSCLPCFYDFFFCWFYLNIEDFLGQPCHSILDIAQVLVNEFVLLQILSFDRDENSKKWK